MANEIVNPQITDSVTQANTKVLGDVPENGNLIRIVNFLHKCYMDESSCCFK